MMLPILYSFRRCPYAIRARLALHVSGITHELREVSLRSKPACLLTASPKGSVPVLVLPDGQVIDESWDIMLWALQQHDPENWLGSQNRYLDQATRLISINDHSFKIALDRYKYADRHPEHPQAFYRNQGETFLQQLEDRLQASACLLGPDLSIADAAIFPFIRQFAGVDPEWFDRSPYPKLRDWTKALCHSGRFADIMRKHEVWQAGDVPLVINGNQGNTEPAFRQAALFGSTMHKP
ncbi:MAG: glutathione S-transferase [Thiobacillus sp.]|nr:glutathione S-transferase [Thiobacillus sp.]